jgi:hypothetical protein
MLVATVFSATALDVALGEAAAERPTAPASRH